MTCKHFELIARAITTASAQGPVDPVITELALRFRAANPRFDRKRFVVACKGTGDVKT